MIAMCLGGAWQESLLRVWLSMATPAVSSKGLELLDSPTYCLAEGSFCLTVVSLKAFSNALLRMWIKTYC